MKCVGKARRERETGPTRRRGLWKGSSTYSFFDLAKLLELLAESGVVGVPGKATVFVQRRVRVREFKEDTYPMKSLVDMV